MKKEGEHILVSPVQGDAPGEVAIATLQGGARTCIILDAAEGRKIAAAILDRCRDADKSGAAAAVSDLMLELGVSLQDLVVYREHVKIEKVGAWMSIDAMLGTRAGRFKVIEWRPISTELLGPYTRSLRMEAILEEEPRERDADGWLVP